MAHQESVASFLQKVSGDVRDRIAEECAKDIRSVLDKWEDRAKTEIVARLKDITFVMQDNHLKHRLEFIVIFPHKPSPGKSEESV